MVNVKFSKNKLINSILEQANDLQPRDFSGTADPYAKIRLLPDKINFWQTKIHKRTLNPSKFFNCFHILRLNSVAVYNAIVFFSFLPIFSSFFFQFSTRTLYSKSDHQLLDVELLRFYCTILIHIHVIFALVALKLIWEIWICHIKLICGNYLAHAPNKMLKLNWAI